MINPGANGATYTNSALVKVIREMTELEYIEYRSRSIPEYAKDTAEASGQSYESALESAESQFNILLPEGRLTKQHAFFAIISEDVQCSDGQKSMSEKVGDLWVCVNRKYDICSVFIYGFEVNAKHRGKGFGSQAMKALEIMGREWGASRIALHVFAHNHKALKLYENLGFYATNINMRKDL